MYCKTPVFWDGTYAVAVRAWPLQKNPKTLNLELKPYTLKNREELGLRVPRLGFKALVRRLEFQGLESLPLKVWGLRLKVWSFGFRV